MKSESPLGPRRVASTGENRLDMFSAIVIVAVGDVYLRSLYTYLPSAWRTPSRVSETHVGASCRLGDRHGASPFPRQHGALVLSFWVRVPNSSMCTAGALVKPRVHEAGVVWRNQSPGPRRG